MSCQTNKEFRRRQAVILFFSIGNHMTTLKILRQESLAVEKVSQNGLFYNAHVVVKNLPFKIILGLSEDESKGSLSTNVLGNIPVNFKSCRLDAKLLFDNPELTEVPFVRTKPIEYTTNIDDQGTTVDTDIKLKVFDVNSFCKIGFSQVLFPPNVLFQIDRLNDVTKINVSSFHSSLDTFLSNNSDTSCSCHLLKTKEPNWRERVCVSLM
jgi:hypothetical protein